MLKFKIGDKVKVVSGKDKGRSGDIERILPKLNKAVVPGINEYKKHVKPSSGQKGGIFSMSRPISFAKLMLTCPNCKKSARIGLRFVGKEKVRYCKKCNKEIVSKK